MAGKNSKSSDSEDESKYEAGDSETELDLYLEKLNLGPKKKLLVMNLNGLLLHRVHRAKKSEIPESREADGRYKSYLVFKRPLSEEFMKFCLERFEVGIWSSAMEHNIDETLNYAIGACRKRMLFIWDQVECTNSGFKCKENARKPLFFKELRKVFEDVKKGGPFSASNTLLIDDKPYKAFLNPPNTGIFPESYDLHNDADSALDPKGELCLFLSRVAEEVDVQSYLKDHPFGEAPITSGHPDWEFYSTVKQSLRQKRGY